MNGTANISEVSNCRVCGRAFSTEPLLRYQNMPAVAQNLPDAVTLKDDVGVDLEVYQCSGCGLTQLNSQPVDYYREVIRASGFSAEMKEFRAKQFTEFVKEHSLFGKKVVEIGCGKGEYLSIMKQSGANAFGIEYADDSVAHCVKNGLSVSKGFVASADYKIDNAPFDAFFILSFLEHLPDLNSVLRGIYNNLSDDAVGIVEVPNFDMILRDNLFSEFMRDHLFYFTKETLSAVLALNGFQFVSCEEVWHNYILSVVVKKIKKLDLSAFAERQNQLKKEVQEYIGQFRNVAVWGAGHQAFAIFSLLDLGDKIKYIVDSAVFKQGKYSPATHIPIVSPDILDSDPVDAIIVMVGSYCDEVVKIIRAKYNKNINVAVLKDFGLEKA